MRRNRDNRPMEPEQEQVLEGGNVAAAVVRVGATVRKPAGPWTAAVEAFLAHLSAAGFTGAPRTLGRDDRGRHVLEYIPGKVAADPRALGDSSLRRVGRLVRDLHDASQGFRPPPGARWNVAIPPDRADLICHHDLAPWNLVMGQDRWVFIDWDGAGPGSRLWDLAWTIATFVPMERGGDPAADARRLRALAVGYRLTAAQRRELPPLIAAHTRGMYELLRASAVTGRQPWARLHAEGHGDHWGPAADYIECSLSTWTRALR
jgi:Ser/Thr protein kinase RdoA (MazF antagonist)